MLAEEVLVEKLLPDGCEVRANRQRLGGQLAFLGNLLLSVRAGFGDSLVAPLDAIAKRLIFLGFGVVEDLTSLLAQAVTW